jgi:hypothetical protein
MSTDLDIRLTAALTDAATTTHVTDDALATIVQRGETNPHPRRRRTLIAGLTVAGVVAGAGTAYAVVADRLDADQAQIIEQITFCGLDAESARLVASTEAYDRTIDYWVVDGEGRHGDFLFERGDTAGGGVCGEQPRQQAHPKLPWVNYQVDTDAGTGMYWFHGQAPSGTAEVRIVMSNGTINTPVAPDGYFVALAELSYNDDVRLERVDALSEDGRVIATGRY